MSTVELADVKRSALLGRDADIAELIEFAKRARDGDGATSLLIGEPGIGKSRLIGEFLHRAELMGFYALYGRVEEYTQQLPYEVLKDALSNLPPSTPEEIAESVDGFFKLLNQSGRSAKSDPMGQRRQLFQAAQELLSALACDRPTILALDDLHVANEDALAMIFALVRNVSRERILVLLATRPTNNSSSSIQGFLEYLAQEDQAVVMDLGPLDRSNIYGLVHSMLGSPPEERLLDLVEEQSRRNPFFAEETVFGLVMDGAIQISDGWSRLVGQSKSLVGRRTALLYRIFERRPSARDLARVAAVLGSVKLSRLELLRSLSGLSESGLDQAFDGLVADRILIKSNDGSYEFAHPIVRSTLYDDIGPAGRRRIHREIAEHIAREDPERSVAETLEYAHHVSESATKGDLGSAKILQDAADVSYLIAPLSAADLYGRSLEIARAADLPYGSTEAKQARAYWIGSRAFEAAEVGRRSLEVLREPIERGRTAALVANALYASGLCEEALDVIKKEVESGNTTSRMLAQEAHILSQLGHRLEAEEIGRTFESEGVLNTSDDDPVALCHLALYADMLGKTSLRESVLQRQHETFDLLPLGSALATAENMAMVLSDSGRVKEADEALARARDITRGFDISNIGGQSASSRIRIDWLTGDWVAALDEARAADYDLVKSSMTMNLVLVRTMRTAILTDLGRFDEAEVIGGLLEEPVLSYAPIIAWVRSKRSMLLGEFAHARTILEEPLERIERAGFSQWSHLHLGALVETTWALGDKKSSRIYLEHLASSTSQTERPWQGCVGARMTALVNHDVGEAERAIEIADTNNLRFEAAQSRMLLGTLKKDADHLTRSVEEFAALGAEPWRRRASGEMRQLGLRPPRISRPRQGMLTDTEAKMARLVQQGLTNRQIASALHYSPKTVEVYLSRIYVKTNCSSRLTLARAMDCGEVVTSA